MTTKKQHKTYHLNQSPLYKLNSRRKLAALFNLSLNKLESLAKRTDNYRVFLKDKNSETCRQFEVPKPHFEFIHRRLFHLLRKVDPPVYLHSGIKGKSYITNAKAHLDSERAITLDIRKFFPSTLGWHVFEFFNGILYCSRDVSGLLTALCTYDNHVPTGSCLSQPLAFYAHYKMFEEINALATSLGLKMTCYVDDMTLSGAKANPSTLYKVRGILNERSLQSKSKKEHVYDIGYPKTITGSIVMRNELRLPNRRHKAIHEEIDQILKLDVSEEKLKVIDSAIGSVISASQSDPSFTHKANLLYQEKERVKKVLTKADVNVSVRPCTEITKATLIPPFSNGG